jgi:hypothetical protein
MTVGRYPADERTDGIAVFMRYLHWFIAIEPLVFVRWVVQA